MMGKPVLQGELIKLNEERFLCADTLDLDNAHFLYLASLDGREICFAEQKDGQVRIINNIEEKTQLAKLFGEKIADQIPLGGLAMEDIKNG